MFFNGWLCFFYENLAVLSFVSSSSFKLKIILTLVGLLRGLILSGGVTQVGFAGLISLLSSKDGPSN